jgi:DNA-binding NtrC family response regulator
MSQQIQNLAAITPRKISETASQSAMHVLVVDDEWLVRWAVTETLGVRGYEVSQAADAKSAIQTIRDSASCIDLVLLEPFLPDSCDLHVLRFIRSFAPAMAVILMTAFATPDLVEEAFALGAAVMIKPFDMNELAMAIDRAVAARSS